MCHAPFLQFDPAGVAQPQSLIGKSKLPHEIQQAIHLCDADVRYLGEFADTADAAPQQVDDLTQSPGAGTSRQRTLRRGRPHGEQRQQIARHGLVFE